MLLEQYCITYFWRWFFEGNRKAFPVCTELYVFLSSSDCISDIVVKKIVQVHVVT